MYVSHPLLNLKVDIDDCAFQLFVNGGLVTSNLRGTAHEEQPLNHWVRTGANDIQLYMYKPADEQDTCDVKLALTVAPYAYVLENGRLVMHGPSEKLRENPDIRDFYLGLSDIGERKSFRNVKHYKRRKRWLA